MHLFKHFIALLTISPIFVGLAYSNPIEIEQRIDEDFHYELFNSDVHCWITRECHGLVSNYPKRKIATRLEDIVSASRRSADFAIFGLRKQDWLVQTLRSLHAKGNKIRVTVDQLRGAIDDWANESNFIYPDAQMLVKFLGKTFVRADVNRDGSARTGSLMHHKFFVLDNRRVWFGSTNLSDTESGAEYNANVSIIIDSPALSNLFTQEFDQMYEGRKYSIYKRARASIANMTYNDGTKVKVLFAPQESPIENGVIPFIKKARKSLDIGIFYLTDSKVVDELIAAKNRGVLVRIINDATAARNLYNLNHKLRDAGIDVRVENWGGKMHMKTAVRDRTDSLIGSANWTQSGNHSNDEHVVIIEKNEDVANQIADYFESLWNTLDSSLDNPRYRDPRPEGPDSINSCEDGIDNDHHGGADQEAFNKGC